MDSDRADERRAVIPLRVFPVLDVEHVTPKRLPPQVAAQIVRAYGETEVQINDTIPARRHALLVGHVVEQHADRCCVRSCVVARAFLRDCALVPVPAAAASA